ncbi:MAG TPA: EAL domain-containing protein, partial [Mycobacteriales bacterium]|nr:EAL domain-containing protein [Mycobacteriales bacterium]HVU61311.1 EAL domain-containing protein [Mycobacteriales bacterium]
MEDPPASVDGYRAVQVLVVDDDPAMAGSLVEIFTSRGLSAVGVTSAGAAIIRERELRPAVVVCDQRLPDMSGLDLCATIRTMDPDVSLILLTGYASLDSAIAAVGQIDQYLTKPVPVDDLVESVEAGVARTEQRVRERIAAEEMRTKLETELRRQASHDSLTGLANRALFSDRAEHALERRGLSELVVCFFDIDDFKDVNDSYGHGAGDELLRVIGQRLRECVRPADTVARFGGDEFAVLLEDTQLPGALDVIDRLYESVNHPIRLGNDEEVVVHLSVGMTLVNSRDVTSEELLAEADAAMYAAKARGKNRYEIFDPSMRSASELRSRLRVELGDALVREDFRLYFQPLIDMVDRDWRGVEALARWPHPQHGLLEPADFVDIAETKGLIVELDRWAIAAACRAAARVEGLNMTVNVSGRTLRHPELRNMVSDALAASGLPGSRLVLDVSDLSSDPERVVGPVRVLHGLGVSVAIDEFTGDIPALRRLRGLEIGYLKIHHSLIADLGSGLAATTIVGAVIDIAHDLGMTTIATGVETAKQCDILAGLGCDLGQGYLWARPAPIDTFEAAVAAQRDG